MLKTWKFWKSMLQNLKYLKIQKTPTLKIRELQIYSRLKTRVLKIMKLDWKFQYIWSILKLRNTLKFNNCKISNVKKDLLNFSINSIFNRSYNIPSLPRQITYKQYVSRLNRTCVNRNKQEINLYFQFRSTNFQLLSNLFPCIYHNIYTLYAYNNFNQQSRRYISSNDEIF